MATGDSRTVACVLCLCHAGSLGSLGIFGAEVVAVVGWSDTDLSCALTPRQADNNKGALSAETTQPATAGGWLCWLTGLFAA